VVGQFNGAVEISRDLSKFDIRTNSGLSELFLARNNVQIRLQDMPVAVSVVQPKKFMCSSSAGKWFEWEYRVGRCVISEK